MVDDGSMKKVLLVATVQSHIAQFHLPLLNLLQDNGYEVHVAANNNLDEKNGLSLKDADKIFNVPFARSPFNLNNFKAYNNLKGILDQYKYEIIHCNTPVGGVITRLLARNKRKLGTKVFYTAHGFHFYKGAPLYNWMLYYPVEKFLARYTDRLITISKEDYQLAFNKKFKTEIHHIHGVGANADKYKPVSEVGKNKLRKELGFAKTDFICICTGELNKNKNQKTLISAIEKVINQIPEIKLLLAGNGPMEDELKGLIREKNLEKHIKLLGYRTDLERFVKASDLAISASIREGLGLNVIEAMLCGKPIIASKNRGHNELIIPNKNGFLVDAINSSEYSEAILNYYRNKEFRKKSGKENLSRSYEYTRDNIIKELKEIYEI